MFSQRVGFLVSVIYLFVYICLNISLSVQFIFSLCLSLGPLLFGIYIDDLPLHTPSDSAEYHMLLDEIAHHTTGKSVVQIQKTLQLCLDRISVWCNVNHLLINPVTTKSMIIATRQKHQLSDLSLRLSLDGQNIENVTEHGLLGLIVDNKFHARPYRAHMQKHVKTKCLFFSTATYHQHPFQKNSSTTLT